MNGEYKIGDVVLGSWTLVKLLARAPTAGSMRPGERASAPSISPPSKL